MTDKIAQNGSGVKRVFDRLQDLILNDGVEAAPNKPQLIALDKTGNKVILKYRRDLKLVLTYVPAYKGEFSVSSRPLAFWTTDHSLPNNRGVWRITQEADINYRQWVNSINGR